MLPSVVLSVTLAIETATCPAVLTRVVVGVLDSRPPKLVLEKLRDRGACGVRDRCSPAWGGNDASARALVVSIAGAVRVRRGMQDVSLEGFKVLRDIRFWQ